MAGRARFLGGLVTLCMLVLVVKSSSLMMFPDPRLQHKANNQFNTPQEIHGRRGDILTADGLSLATSVEVQTLHADPSKLTNETARILAKTLAPMLELKVNPMVKRLSKRKRKDVQLAKNLVPDQIDGIMAKVDALIEQRMPGWRGVPVEEVYTPEMLAYIRGKGLDFVPPEGDSPRMVQRRVATWLEDEIIYNKDLSGTETSLTVAIVGHGAATRCLIHYIMGFSDRFIERISLGNCSISRFLFDSEGWALHCLNDTCHIDGSGA